MTNLPHLWLPRFWPAIVVFHGGMFMMAVFFGGVVILGGTPVTPDLYGPAVYAIPALAWAGAQAGGALLCVVGAGIRGRAGAMILAIGSAASVIVYGFFAAAASLAEQGTLVQAATLFVGAPLSVLSGVAGVGAFRYGGR